MRVRIDFKDIGMPRAVQDVGDWEIHKENLYLRSHYKVVIIPMSNILTLEIDSLEGLGEEDGN